MSELNISMGRLAERLGGTLAGSGEATITGIAPLESAGENDITFVSDARHASALASTRAAGAIVAGDFAADAPAAVGLIRVPDVQWAVAEVLAMIGEDEDLPGPGVHPAAIVADDARIGDGAAIGPGAVVAAAARIGAGAVLCANAVVEAGAEIGENTILLPATVVCRRCRVGRRCRIGPAAVIGSSGFGHQFDGKAHRRFPHVGSVEIGDGVDIGACSCVDRGKFGVTRIGEGTKIDNLVQIAHNVQIGRGCLLAALAGVAGSAVLKDFVVFGGHVGVRDHVTVGAGVRTGACSCIAQDVPDGAVVAGIPAIQGSTWLRSVRVFSRLSELQAAIRELQKKVAAIESAADHQGTR